LCQRGGKLTAAMVYGCIVQPPSVGAGNLIIGSSVA
jgi:hypothetical protein